MLLPRTRVGVPVSPMAGDSEMVQGKSSEKGQIVNIIVFVGQEAKMKLLSSVLIYYLKCSY